MNISCIFFTVSIDISCHIFNILCDEKYFYGKNNEFKESFEPEKCKENKKKIQPIKSYQP